MPSVVIAPEVVHGVSFRIVVASDESTL